MTLMQRIKEVVEALEIRENGTVSGRIMYNHASKEPYAYQADFRNAARVHFTRMSIERLENLIRQVCHSMEHGIDRDRHEYVLTVLASVFDERLNDLPA